MLLNTVYHCRLVAAPSVAFNERAIDLLKEDDLHSTQPGASDAEWMQCHMLVDSRGDSNE